MQSTLTAHTDVSSAKQLFARGNDFLSTADLIASLKKDYVNEDKIPYTMEQLQKAKEAGLMLTSMLSGLTMEGVVEKVGNKMSDDKNLLYSIDWYKNENFYTKTKTRGGAYFTPLVGLSDSSVNYFKQTKILADWVKVNSYLSVNPAKVEQYAEDFYSKEKMLQKALNESWQKGGQALSELDLNHNCRERASEMTLRLLAYKKVNDVCLHKNTYAWLADIASDSRLVSLGDCDADGVRVSDWRASRSSGDLLLVPCLQ